MWTVGFLVLRSQSEGKRERGRYKGEEKKGKRQRESDGKEKTEWKRQRGET